MRETGHTHEAKPSVHCAHIRYRLSAFPFAILVVLLASLATIDNAVADPMDASAGSEQEATASPPNAETPPPPEVKNSPLPRMDTPPPPGGAARRPGSHADIVALIDREAKRAGLPEEVAEAVTHTESGFNRNAVGGDGEIGLMQVLPSTARMMGFSGSLAELANPETNIRYGVTYLAQAWRRAGGDLCTAVMKYRAGHGESRFSRLSVDYCLKIRARLASRGFKVAGIVPTATFGSPAGRGCRSKCLAGFGGGPNLAALNAKLSQIAFRVTVMKVPMR